MAAHSDSDVLKQMASSRMITRKMIEIQAFPKMELRDYICKALVWRYMLNESTDKFVNEEVMCMLALLM